MSPKNMVGKNWGTKIQKYKQLKFAAVKNVTYQMSEHSLKDCVLPTSFHARVLD